MRKDRRGRKKRVERKMGYSSFSNNCKVIRDNMERVRKGEKLVMGDFLIEEGWNLSYIKDEWGVIL